VTPASNRRLHLPRFRHDFDATWRKSDRPASGFFAILLMARDSRGTNFSAKIEAG
jgi:hypothetical protein